MAARDNILARIRAARGRAGPADSSELAAVAAYVDAHAGGPRPLSQWEPLPRFRERAASLSTTLDEVA